MRENRILNGGAESSDNFKEEGVVSMEIIITVSAIGMLIAGFSALYLNRTTETNDPNSGAE